MTQLSQAIVASRKYRQEFWEATKAAMTHFSFSFSSEEDELLVIQELSAIQEESARASRCSSSRQEVSLSLEMQSAESQSDSSLSSLSEESYESEIDEQQQEWIYLTKPLAAEEEKKSEAPQIIMIDTT